MSPAGPPANGREHVQTASGTERLPRFGRDGLEPGQQVLYDTLTSGARTTQAAYFPVADDEGVLSGPYRAMLLSPVLGGPMERLGRAVRFEGSLPDRVRELIILTVAVLTESDTEWRAHERLAGEAGVPVAELRSPESDLSEDDAQVHRFVVELLRDHTVSDATFAALHDRFGRGGLLEAVVTAGYYQTIAHINNAFDLDSA